MKTLAAVSAGIVVVVALTTLPTYWLWNWLMPAIFGLPRITIGQALGIVVLAQILFRGNNGTSKNE